jgi:dTDP-4-dehydrorhamnose reductase
MNILVLGAAGLLGNTVFRVLSEVADLKVFGTVRSVEVKSLFITDLSHRLIIVSDLMNYDEMQRLFDQARPQVVVNCVAIGRAMQKDLDALISIFSVFPQRLAHLCQLSGARFVQISSDGVFSGSRGDYSEDDVPDASDAYGIAKLLGEVRYPGSITLRTSIVGPELESNSGILEWFLSQNDECSGFTRAIFSGFPTVVLARLIRDVIIPRHELSGLFHVATTPISKFDLLELIAKRYGKSISLIPDDSVVVDRSLCTVRFRAATGYVAPEWSEMIDLMYSYNYGLARK